MTYLILDTEGIEELREIAIIDHNGTLIYEAFTAGNPKNSHIRLKLKPLAEILTDLTKIAENKTIICHYAKHDRLNFELIYNTITDIENQDLEYSLSEALKALVTLQGDYWLIKLI